MTTTPTERAATGPLGTSEAQPTSDNRGRLCLTSAIQSRSGPRALENVAQKLHRTLHTQRIPVGFGLLVAVEPRATSHRPALFVCRVDLSPSRRDSADALQDHIGAGPIFCHCGTPPCRTRKHWRNRHLLNAGSTPVPGALTLATARPRQLTNGRRHSPSRRNSYFASCRH
jgi:hypothetical protein